ncbi:hypothetical protein ABW44_14525 [Stenotrophomonas maltophilia]|nr:hypothetical protein ABW44_14525 [Stenotrophomonas maltophilia]
MRSAKRRHISESFDIRAGMLRAMLGAWQSRHTGRPPMIHRILVAGALSLGLAATAHAGEFQCSA